MRVVAASSPLAGGASRPARLFFPLLFSRTSSMSNEHRTGRRPLALALTVALALALAGAAPSAAHDFWIVPSSSRPAAGGPLAVRLKVGERLVGDPVPRDPAQIERFALVGPGGEAPIQAPAGS